MLIYCTFSRYKGKAFSLFSLVFDMYALFWVFSMVFMLKFRQFLMRIRYLWCWGWVKLVWLMEKLLRENWEREEPSIFMRMIWLFCDSFFIIVLFFAYRILIFRVVFEVFSKLELLKWINEDILLERKSILYKFIELGVFILYSCYIWMPFARKLLENCILFRCILNASYGSLIEMN